MGGPFYRSRPPAATGTAPGPPLGPLLRTGLAARPESGLWALGFRESRRRTGHVAIGKDDQPPRTSPRTRPTPIPRPETLWFLSPRMRIRPRLARTVLLATCLLALSAPASAQNQPRVWRPLSGAASQPFVAPEIDASLMGRALVLLFGGVLVLTARGHQRELG